MTNDKADNAPERIYHCSECLDSNWCDIGSHRVSCHQSGRRKYEYVLKSSADKREQNTIQTALDAYKERIRKDEYVFILERDNDGKAHYLHDWDCSNYCDYACNGDEGFKMAEVIKDKELEAGLDEKI